MEVRSLNLREEGERVSKKHKQRIKTFSQSVSQANCRHYATQFILCLNPQSDTCGFSFPFRFLTALLTFAFFTSFFRMRKKSASQQEGKQTRRVRERETNRGGWWRRVEDERTFTEGTNEGRKTGPRRGRMDEQTKERQTEARTHAR